MIVEPGTYPTTIAKNRVTAEDSERLAPYAQAVGLLWLHFLRRTAETELQEIDQIEAYRKDEKRNVQLYIRPKE